MPTLNYNFGLLEEYQCDYQRSRVAILPVPFERTTSYGKGTSAGPEAILAASRYLELYDEELDSEASSLGVATLPPFLPGAFGMEEALTELEGEAYQHLQAGKFLVTLGGEHSLTLALVRAARRAVGELGVVQFDAHADLRVEYEGSAYSHACVMRRIVEQQVPTLAIGLRSLSREEAELRTAMSLPVIWAQSLDRAEEELEKFLDVLPEKIYLTFDVDYFDPALVPATGTPEPGGGTWYPTLRLLRRLFQKKQVVAMDLVELAPIAGQPASDFLAAKLLYKCLGYLQLKEHRTTTA